MNQSFQTDHVKEIGKYLVDHFCNMFSPGDSFIFCVDQEFLDSVYLNLGFSKEECERKILSKFVNGCLFDRYVSVAIAGFQVSVAYDNLVHSISSYNRVLCNKLKYEESQLQKVYKQFQIDIWKSTKDCFAKKGIELLIPMERTGQGCYVQYPLSQKVITNANLVKYKDIFTRIHLDPDKEISFEQFSERVFGLTKIYAIHKQLLDDNLAINHEIFEEIARKIIYFFYLAWNGEYQKKERSGRKETEAQPIDGRPLKPEISFLRVCSDQSFQCLDSKEKIIPIKEIGSKKSTFYSFDATYSLWVEVPNIQKADSFGKVINTSFLEYLIKCNKILGLYILETYKNEDYTFAVFGEMMPSQIYQILQCDFGKKSWVSFCGGLKNPNREWIIGILPTLKFEENYTEVFIDSKRVPVQNGSLDLNTISLSPGSHSVKEKSTEIIYFSVANPLKKQQSDSFGWVYTWQAAPITSTQIEESVIHGLVFKPFFFPKSNNLKKLGGTMQLVLNRNIALHSKPYTKEIRIQLVKGRMIYEF